MLAIVSKEDGRLETVEKHCKTKRELRTEYVDLIVH
jgi:hypothetical protein